MNGARVLVVGESSPVRACAEVFELMGSSVEVGTNFGLHPDFDVVVTDEVASVIAEALAGDSVPLRDCVGVVLHCSHWGASGPRAGAPADDQSLYAQIGLMALNENPELPPVALPGMILSRMAALQAYATTVGVLTGQSNPGWVTVEVAASELLVNLNWQIANAAYGGQASRSAGKYFTRRNYPLTTFRCSDGFVYVNCRSEDQWQRLTVLVGRPDLSTDERYRRGPDRGANAEILDGALEPWFTERTRDEATHACQEMRIPCSPVLSLAEADAVARSSERQSGPLAAQARQRAGLGEEALRP